MKNLRNHNFNSVCHYYYCHIVLATSEPDKDNYRNTHTHLNWLNMINIYCIVCLLGGPGGSMS